MKEYLQAIQTKPFVYKEKLFDGSELSQNISCRKCKEKACLSFEGDYYECPKDFSCLAFSINDERFFLNGLIYGSKNTHFSGKRRKQYKNYIIRDKEVSYLKTLLSETTKYIEKETNNRILENVGFLHEIRTSVGMVLNWCQKIISSQPGKNFEQQIEESSIEIKNLFNSINLLRQQIDLSDMIVNPAAIAAGRKQCHAISDFIYKLVKLFEPLAEKKDCKIIKQGHPPSAIEVYQSFSSVPFILFDNAIKYSFNHQTIIVDCYEEKNDFCFSITSYGQIVPKEYRDRIFEKGIRAPNAQETVGKGMGLGLYMAKRVVEANHGSIAYEYKYKILHTKEGKNTFTVKIPLKHHI